MIIGPEIGGAAGALAPPASRLKGLLKELPNNFQLPDAPPTSEKGKLQLAPYVMFGYKISAAFKTYSLSTVMTFL